MAVLNKITIDHDFEINLNYRKKESHKGSYGKVLILAGSKAMVGASILSSLSAYKSGSGLVKVLIEEGCDLPIFTRVPEVIVSTYKRNLEAFESEKYIFLEALNWADTILIGPGMGTDEYAVNLFYFILNHTSLPLVIDADGLNILSKDLAYIKNYNGPVIMTPHIGEMSRLIQKPIDKILKNTQEEAIKFTQNYPVSLVLKSDETLVSTKESLYINKLGNPGMATAGSGDVLAGIIVSLLGQGYSQEDAAAYGVAIHSRAGDLAKENYGEHSLMASDIIEFIHKVLKKINNII